MKKLLFFLLFTASNPLWSKCNTGHIGVYHESGFGISFGGGSSSAGFYDKDTTNVPLSINNQPACFKKTSKYSMKGEIKKDHQTENKIIISPLKVEFENVPSAHVRQYLFIEKNINPLLRKVHQLNFICAGGIPLSIEGGSDFVISILGKTDTPSVNVTHVFAMGTAAENLKPYHSPSTRDSFEFFKKLYQNKTLKEISSGEDCCHDIKVPSILSDTSIHSLAGVERKLASSFTTMGAEVPNGCSEDFIKSMEPYLLENFEKNESLEGIKIKKKWFSEDLILEI